MLYVPSTTTHPEWFLVFLLTCTQFYFPIKCQHTAKNSNALVLILVNIVMDMNVELLRYLKLMFTSSGIELEESNISTCPDYA